MDEDIARCSEQQLLRRRRAGVGFVFQNFNLIDDLDVAANVAIGLIYRRMAGVEKRECVAAALEQVGLTHRARHLPSQLSGGQQQRVAVARALVANPKVILADEPTGNLDTANGEAVMQMLVGVARAGTTVVMVTHSAAHAALADRVVHMLDGRLRT
jgi:putative ABC transport system ATP-binding protein